MGGKDGGVGAAVGSRWRGGPPGSSTIRHIHLRCVPEMVPRRHTLAVLPCPRGPRAPPRRDYGHVCHRATSSFSRSRKCSTTFHFEAIVNCVLICFTYYMFLQFILQMYICSDVSEELIAYAERLEANPPRVVKMELASGLRRLAQRCIRAVRRASCRARRTRQFHSTGPVPRTLPMLVHQTQLLQPVSMQGPLCPPDLLVRIIVLCFNYLQLIGFSV